MGKGDPDVFVISATCADTTAYGFPKELPAEEAGQGLPIRSHMGQLLVKLWSGMPVALCILRIYSSALILRCADRAAIQSLRTVGACLILPNTKEFP